MRAERRVVTVLSVDVVGSTAMAELLGAEDARLILGEALTRAVTVIEAYGGTVKDLAGDGVLALFGAPVAHDDDAERAVRAALDITADISRQAAEVERGWGIDSFNVRVGLHTGDVVVGAVGAGSRIEYGAIGDTVNTAARLQAAAAPGQVIVSAVTARLVERVTELGPPEKMDLKGKAETVVAHVVAGLRSHAAPRRGRSDVVVGRSAELAVGQAALEALASGEGGLLWVLGDAGLGKTRFLAELAGLAHSLDLGWAEGRCASYGEALPYWPVRDLLRGFFAVSAQDPAMKQRLAVRKTLGRLLPEQLDVSVQYLAELLGLSGEESAVSPEALQFRTFEVVGELLSAWAATRPAVIVIDDLHWADATSLALLESLFVRTETEPLLVVMAMRPDTSRASWALRERSLREFPHISSVVELAPLGPADEAELIDRLLAGVEVPPELMARLAAFAGGNPFYLEELVQGLETGGAGDPTFSLDIPETLEAVILARVDRLEPEWRRVLAAAAPLGRSFGVPLLGAVSGADQAAVRQALHHLRRLDLLAEESRLPHPTYRFKHALIQEAVYRSLLSDERAALHRRAAEWLTETGGDRVDALYPLLAYHWLAAGDRSQAIAYARLAGDQARDNNALEEAVTHYRTLVRLLDETGQGSEAAGVLYQLATTLYLASRYREAQEVWDRAFELPRPAVTVPAEDVELRIGIRQLPWDPNPVHGYFASNMTLVQQMYDRLIEPVEGPALTPGMAERWRVSDDGRVLTLHLRTGLAWNDGAPLDAWQIAASIRQSMLPASENADLPILLTLEGAEAWTQGRCEEQDFAGIMALDGLTLQFRLAAPAPYFPFVLMYPSVGPYRADGVGTGPYRLERLDDERVEVVRAPAYTRRRGGNVGRISFTRLQPDEIETALRDGDVDVCIGATGTEARRDMTVLGPAVLSVFLVLNAANADVHLRRALATAVDREVVRDRLAFTDVVATGGLVPPGLAGHTPDIAVPFDPDAARAHLAKSASLAPGEPIRAWTAIEQAHPWWDGLMDCWREVLGVPVEVTIEPMAANVGFPTTNRHAALWHWVAGYPDPDYFLRVLLHSQSSSNAGGWHDDRFDAMIDRTVTAAGERTGAERMALFHEADRLAVRDECAVIPLTYRRGAAVVQPYVEGWWLWGAPLQVIDGMTVRRPGR